MKKYKDLHDLAIGAYVHKKKKTSYVILSALTQSLCVHRPEMGYNYIHK